MKKRHRRYCPYCKTPVVRKQEENGPVRDFCEDCHTFFYDNPLPVVSSILTDDRRILLVKRKNKPYRGKWCLPSGFAESGESVAEAALRELNEETGVTGRIVNLVHVDSATNYFYGDLLFLTFEVQWMSGPLEPGDDAEAVKFFPLDRVPKLAFSSNRKAVAAYIHLKQESWAIADSFSAAIGDSQKRRGPRRNLLSDSLVALIEEHAEEIAGSWLADVTNNRSTPGYHHFSPERLIQRMLAVTSHLGQCLEGACDGRDIRTYYIELGRKRYREGFALSEVISALSLIRKHIWSYARSKGMWKKTIDMYTVIELERRLMLFFDRASFYIIRGYESRTTSDCKPNSNPRFPE